MVSLNEYILNSDDPFEYVYEGISGTYGEDVMDYLNEIYNQIVIDYGYHPDDDFEEIIGMMLDQMEAEG